MNKITTCILVGMALSVPMMTTSCSLVSGAVSKISSVDMSKYPGLSTVAKAQENMMADYRQSADLILQSRLAALEALKLDAEAYAETDKAGESYDKAKEIAEQAQDYIKKTQAEQQNLQNTTDWDVCNKAVSNTKAVDDFVRESNAALAGAVSGANSSIAASNAQGDAHNLAAVQHVDGAKTKIAESYGLLQKAQLKEAELAVKASAQSYALVKGMEGASVVDKAALGITFRPIAFFLTGLPTEISDQNKIKEMWQEHAKQVQGLVLPKPVQLPNLAAAKSSGAKVMKALAGGAAPKFSF